MNRRNQRRPKSATSIFSRLHALHLESLRLYLPTARYLIDQRTSSARNRATIESCGVM